MYVGGLVTTVPTTADEAKKMGEDLIQKKGGKMLSKISGAYICSRDGLVFTTHAHPRMKHVHVHASKCKHMHGGSTGGLVTTVPTSVDEAKKMGEDLIKTKGGVMLSKLSGTHTGFEGTCFR